MNKMLKRTTASLLAVAAVTVVGPVKYTSLLTKEANAAETTTGAKKAELKNLEVSKSSSGSELQLYDDDRCKRSDETEFKGTEERYYVNIKSGNKVYIKPEVESGYKYEITKGSRDYDDEDKITVSSSSTTIKVKVWEEANKNNYRDYTIKVLRDTDDKDEDKDEDSSDYDDIYLDNLEVDGKDIDLKENKTTYTVNVDEDDDRVKIVAEPEDDEYRVRIAGETVEEDDDYEKKVSLEKGKNEIEIRLKNDDEKRIYTLIINRGSSTEKEENKNTTSNSSSNTTSNVRPNQWVTVNGNLMYNDSLGNSIKNAWFIDRSNGAWYYFDNNGYAKKGWLNNNGAWYYLNEYSGQMQKGWSYINGQWYYLASTGAMQTGWINDGGKWYFCDGSGKMLKNTTVNGYKLGSNGAWIR